MIDFSIIGNCPDKRKITFKCIAKTVGKLQASVGCSSWQRVPVCAPCPVCAEQCRSLPGSKETGELVALSTAQNYKTKLLQQQKL